MTPPFAVDRILGDRPFAEVGDPVLAVADKRRNLLAVAGTHEYYGSAPVGVYDTDDLACGALLRSRYPVQAMAFHPTLPLLAVGTGRYDGGYFFEGELLLLDLETGEAATLIEHRLGRQVVGLEWLDAQALRAVMAPPDDWQDDEAHVEGHVAVLRRLDWRAVAPRSITGYDLAGPRVPAPRPDGREAARRTLSDLSRMDKVSVRSLRTGACEVCLTRRPREGKQPTELRLSRLPRAFAHRYAFQVDSDEPRLSPAGIPLSLPACHHLR